MQNYLTSSHLFYSKSSLHLAKSILCITRKFTPHLTPSHFPSAPQHSPANLCEFPQIKVPLEQIWVVFFFFWKDKYSLQIKIPLEQNYCWWKVKSTPQIKIVLGWTLGPIPNQKKTQL